MIRLKKRIVKRKKSLLLLFVNRFIINGKKDFIYKYFLIILVRLKFFLKLHFNIILRKILLIICPLVQLKPKFASGIIYLIPAPLKLLKSISLGLNWLIKAIRNRREYNFKYRLLFELKDILNFKGYSLKYKNEYYKLVMFNRALLFRFKNK
jgi:ribosomal protein S7